MDAMEVASEAQDGGGGVASTTASDGSDASTPTLSQLRSEQRETNRLLARILDALERREEGSPSPSWDSPSREVRADGGERRGDRRSREEGASAEATGGAGIRGGGGAGGAVFCDDGVETEAEAEAEGEADAAAVEPSSGAGPRGTSSASAPGDAPRKGARERSSTGTTAKGKGTTTFLGRAVAALGALALLRGGALLDRGLVGVGGRGREGQGDHPKPTHRGTALRLAAGYEGGGGGEGGEAVPSAGDIVLTPARISSPVVAPSTGGEALGLAFRGDDGGSEGGDGGGGERGDEAAPSAVVPARDLQADQGSIFAPGADLTSNLHLLDVCHWVEIDLFYDDHPDEISWTLEQISASGEAETIRTHQGAEGDTFHVETLCLQEGRYNFTLEDECGDGMWVGRIANYTIRTSSGTLVAQGGVGGEIATLSYVKTAEGELIDQGFGPRKSVSFSFSLPYTPAPSSSPSSSVGPTASQKPSQDLTATETCGNGKGRGDGLCTENLCCSSSGWCWLSDAHCRADQCEGSHSERCGCRTVVQADYRGSIHTTRSGLECEDWDAEWIGKEYGLFAGKHQFGGGYTLESNYCRNPDGDPDGAWCFTKDRFKGNGGRGFDYCDVPTCEDSALRAPSVAPSSSMISLDILDPRPKDTPLPGSAVKLYDGRWIINGWGEIWEEFDRGFRFVAVKKSGNVVAELRVDSFRYLYEWQKAALMIRESLDSDSKHYSIVKSGGDNLVPQIRDQTRQETSQHQGGGIRTEGRLPFWVQVRKNGNAFTSGYKFEESAEWTYPWEPLTIDFASETFYVGIAVSSYHESEEVAVLEARDFIIRDETIPSASPSSSLSPSASLAPSLPSACDDSNYRTCGCSNVNQADYRGQISTTKSGYKCETWADSFAQLYPDAGLEDGNFCRNPTPDADQRAWCFTREPGAIGYEECDIPMCDAPSDTNLQPFTVKVMAKSEGDPLGEYFRYKLKTFYAVFNSIVSDDGTVFNVNHWRQNRIIWSGDIEVWPGGIDRVEVWQGENDWEYPPFGRRQSSLDAETGASDGAIFRDGDWITPSVVKVGIYRHPIYRPHGTFFTFDQNLMENVILSSISENGTILKVEQLRGDDLVWSGNVILWAPKSDSSLGLKMPVMGRRDPSEGGYHFQDGDKLKAILADEDLGDPMLMKDFSPSQYMCEGRDAKCCGSTEVNQMDYLGSIDTTQKGYKCSSWGGSDYGIENKSSCRNPDNRDQAWCFTEGDNDSGWDYCKVPECITKSTTLARTVQVQLRGTNFLALAEVEVNDPDGVNRARDKSSTTQSSTFTKSILPGAKDGALGASKALNGFLDDFTLTDFEEGAWWQVDLGEEVEVAEIIIHNRFDCCKERLSDSVVSLLDERNETVKEYYIDDASNKQVLVFKSPSCAGSRPDACGCVESAQEDYRGEIKTTESGYECADWTEDMIKTYPYAGLDDGNFCRNPSSGGKDRAWCYTTNPFIIDGWEYCNVPPCFPSATNCPYFDFSKDDIPPDDIKTACAYHECSRDYEYDAMDVVRGEFVNNCQCLFVIWDCEYGRMDCKVDDTTKRDFDCCNNGANDLHDFVAARDSSCECLYKLPCEAGDAQKCYEYAEHCCGNDPECKCEYRTKACRHSQKDDSVEDHYCNVAADDCCSEVSVEIGGCRCDFWDDLCQAHSNFCGQASLSCCSNDDCYCDFLTHARDELDWLDEKNEAESYCRPREALSSAAELISLQTIYNETGGAHWIKNTGWMTVVDHCNDWHGVSCDVDGSVTKIILRSNNVTGKFPSNALAKLYRLETLDLGDNNLWGSMAGTFRSIGGDDLVDKSVFFPLQELARVDLSENRLAGNIDLLFAPALVHVNVSHNEFTAANRFNEFKRSWGTLRDFDLSHNSIQQEATDFMSIIPPFIEKFIFSHNLMYGTLPSSLDSLEYLAHFVGGSNSLSGPLPEFSSSFDLQELDLSNQKLETSKTGGFTGTIPLGYSNPPFLSTLNLSGNRLSSTIPPVLSNLVELKHFDLSDNDLSQLIPHQLGKLEGTLEYINISNNRLSGQIPKELGLLRNALAINLKGNEELERPAPLSLCLVRFDQKDDAAYCPPERETLKSFYESTKGGEWTNSSNWLSEYDSYCDWNGVDCDNATNNIIKLNLTNNGLSGQLDKTLGNLRSIEVLDLSDNDIKGTIPSELGLLYHLKTLRLAYNAFIDTVPEELDMLNHLELVQLHSNRLSGSMPSLNFTLVGDDYSFVTDCGVPSIFEEPFSCPDCTMCCNMEEHCYPTEEPNIQKVEKGGFMTYVNFSWVFFLCMFAFCYILALLSYFYDRHRSLSQRGLEARRRPSVIRRRDSAFALESIGKDSVYKYYLTTNWWGWAYASAVLAAQLWALFIFVIGAEFQLWNDNSDLVYTFSCPRDQLECYDRADLTWQGWTVFFILMTAHLSGDIINGLKLVVFSGRVRHDKGTRARSFIGGLALFFVTTFTAYVSAIYNVAIATSNTEIIINSVIILFITTLDELFYAIMVTANNLWEGGISGMAEEVPEMGAYDRREKDDREDVSDMLRAQNSTLNENLEMLQQQNLALREQRASRERQIEVLQTQNKLLLEQNELLRKFSPVTLAPVVQDGTVYLGEVTTSSQDEITQGDGYHSCRSLEDID